MKVLLIQPPIEDFYLTEIRTYPLGLLYLGTLLKKNGVDVSILDCLKPYKKKTIPLPKEFNYLKEVYSEKEIGPLKLFGAYYRFGLTDDEIIKKVCELSPDYIGITCNFTAYFNIVAALAEKIKAVFPNTKIIIGGYHATVYKEDILLKHSCIDKVISGSDENDFLRVLGLPEDESHCFTRTVPDRSLINSSYYKMHRKNFSFLIATRGCPRKCTFCTVASMHGSNFIKRSVASILEEMSYLCHHENVRVFDFEDDNLSLDRNWFDELLAGVTETFRNDDIRLYAMNGISAETLSEELLQKMWQAGFRNLNVSLVTAQDSLKEKLRRPFLNEQFELVVKAAVLLGFEVTAYLIIGLPDQTKEDIQETIEYLSGLNVLIAPSIYYPPPGTEQFSELVAGNRVDPDNWISFRSSVFPVETDFLSRKDLVYYFQYIRMLNFYNEIKKKYASALGSIADLNSISPFLLENIDVQRATEEEIGIAQLKEYLASGKMLRIYRK
ncbi:MAG: hypothetical protein DKM50_02330 [Candidatus Margulisiibacteriota bacterium]|nr:MAG: hypothetical protein A2X43_06785 [Candidatus Margulisbacteria bacterium GWD2_39_127]PZM83553.1 MAG: hypothetical protein DKM50_02330 [Candidatus Margulisiibacteriota bacterium]HAR64269.1 hypothetical protein [Candidatus Margulisiibacteriota bacterium]HCY36589.1 hypothetical protein [Candidatus Margulisiibacteriota bacterium]